MRINLFKNACQKKLSGFQTCQNYFKISKSNVLGQSIKKKCKNTKSILRAFKVCVH